MATVNPSEVNQDVVWSVVSGNTIVSVNQSGLVTALLNGVATVRATSVEDNTKYDEIEITVNASHVGLETLENEISVYPNPTNEHVSISLNQSYESIAIKIIDGSGRELLNNDYSNTDFIQLNLSSFSTGVYQLIIQTENYSITKKIHKQ